MSDFKINVNKFNSSEKIITALKITHAKLNTAICLIDDNQSLVVEGDEYLPFPFKLKPVDQVQDELPQATLTIPNMSSQIVKWIDMTMGAKNANFQFITTRRSTKTIDYKINLKSYAITVDSSLITFKLNIQIILLKEQ